MKKLFTVVVAVALSGCNTITGKLLEIEAPEKAARVVDEYCASVPLLVRHESRAAVNLLTVQGDIFVYCVGDPDAPQPE